MRLSPELAAAPLCPGPLLAPDLIDALYRPLPVAGVPRGPLITTAAVSQLSLLSLKAFRTQERIASARFSAF
jgi:hypothetical protein